MAEVPVKQYFRQAAVPVYQGSVAQRPILQQPLTVKATENDFGAQVGKGMQSLGEGLGKMAEFASKLRDLQADTTAKDSKTAFERAKLALEHGENGYLNTSGQGAVEGYPGYEDALAKLQKTFEPKDPLAAGRYEAMVAPVVTTSLEAAIKHKAQGQKEWVGKAAEGRLSLAKDQAIAGYNKPEQINSAVASGVNEIHNLGKLNGWTPEVIVAKAMDFITGLHTGVAMTMAGKPGGATAAMEYLKANSAQVDPKARTEVENKIRPFAIDEKGKQIATEIVSEKRNPAGAVDKVVTGAVDKAPSGKADTGSGENAGTRGGANAGKDVGNTADGGDANARSGQTSAHGVDGSKAEEPQRGGPTRAKAFLVSISAKPDRPGDALPLDNALAENTKALIEDAPEDIRKGLGVSFVDPTSRASAASASSVSSGRSIQLTYQGRPLDQAPAQVLDWLHDNAEQYGLRFPYETDPSSTAPEAFGRGGSTLVAARDGVAARSNMLSEAEAVKRINQIADEEVRASTKRHFSNEVNVISNAEIEKSRSAKMEVLQAVMNGRPVSDVALDVQIAAGPDTVNAAKELEAKSLEAKSKLDLYYELSMKSAVEPHQFLKVDLTVPEIVNNLSREHWKNLHDKQMSVLNREITDERDGTFYKQAFSEASLTLKAAGIRDASKIVRFNARFQHEIDQWVKRKGEYPTFAERQTMINMLTMEVTYVEKRSWLSPMKLIDDDEDQVGKGFMFDNDLRPEGSEVRVVAKYERIGIEDRKRIYKALMRKYGRAPTPGEIDKQYRDEAMEQVGTD
ncbi:hypothetical protein EYC79_13515 [Agrobacterium cavarae]|uniref:Uncharacterized protein n=1 Tax=Agrobacterium cavarae TaxID=2528239 RepID=A0ABY1Y6S8_9HYPH|nr:hypothetical protein [Agrobacterium cavarae]TBN11291.1 hypothetical protein EYC79_13515 [Agrobacterium cavarae]